jgi:cell division transport system ATP-binding protein
MLSRSGIRLGRYGAAKMGTATIERPAVRTRTVRRARTVALPRPMLEIAALRKSYGRRRVLDELTFSASLGELVAVTGVSGAGKTTLLRLLYGQFRPDAGRLWVNGHPLHRRLLRGAEQVRRNAGFIFQDHRLLPRLTAIENVIFALQVQRPDVPFGVIKRAARESLEVLGLEEARNQFPVQLSEGERQRVAVARAMAGRPPLILADEPMASLDERNAQLVIDQLAAAANAGSLVIVSTHHLDFPSSQVVHLPRLEAKPRKSRLRRR